MTRRVAGLKHLVPFFHLRVVQADFLEHGDPLVYVHLIFHMFFAFSALFNCVAAMTKGSLKCEPIDGSTLRFIFFLGYEILCAGRGCNLLAPGGS